MNIFQDILSSYFHNPTGDNLQDNINKLFAQVPQIQEITINRVNIISLNSQEANNYRLELVVSAINGEKLPGCFRESQLKSPRSPFLEESFKSFLVEHDLSSEVLESFCYTLLKLGFKHSSSWSSMGEFISLVQECSQGSQIKEEAFIWRLI